MNSAKRIFPELHVAIVGSCGVPARYGGFETLAEHLVRELEEDDEVRFTVYCDRSFYRDGKPTHFAGANLIYLRLKANGWQSMFYDAWSSLHAVLFRRAKVILVLGVSGAWFFPFLRLFTDVRIITNVDGIEWRRPKWSRPARQLLKALEWFAVKFSHSVIADNDGIAELLLDRYETEAQTIAYGGNHAVQETKAKSPAFLPLKPYALTVCRIEPENNIHTLVQTFAQSAAISNLRLVVVGRWDGSAYAADLRAQYGGLPNIDLIDPIYDQNQLYVLRRQAACFVHGHSAGGTNPTLVEAMFFGKPVFAFDCVFNRNTTEETALFFDDHGSLKQLIEQWQTHVLEQSGRKLKEIAERRYQWHFVAQDYAALIDAVATQKKSIQ